MKSVPGRALIALASVLVAGASWVALREGCSQPKTAVFGLYRERNFLLALALSYGALWLLVWAWRGTSRKALARFLAAHAGLAFLALALEGAAAFGLVDFRTVLGRGAGSAGPKSKFVRNVDPGDPNDEVGARYPVRWIGRPGVRVEGTVFPDLERFLGVTGDPVDFAYETDAYGLRNPSGKGDPEVLCLGDSILVGGLLPAAETCTELLEERLGTTVLKVAEVGYSPQEELLRLDTTGIDVDGKLVLHFLFEGNDLSDSKTWRRWREKGGGSWPQSGLAKTLLARLHAPIACAAQHRYATLDRGAGPERIYFLYDARRIEAHADELDVLLSVVTAARADIEARGGRYAVVFVPAKVTVLGELCEWPVDTHVALPEGGETVLRARLREHCAGEDIAYRDVTGALRESVRGGELPYFPADTHPNAVGHRVLADEVGTWARGLRD